MKYRAGEKSRDRGANLVEFALVMPVLLLVLLGLVDFAWVFSQNLDVRHGAREGARLIAVNYPDGPVNPPPSSRDSAQTTQIVAEVCDRMDLATGAMVTLQSAGGVGDAATATVAAPAETLSGFVDWAFPPSLTLTSTVEIRVEQPAGWENTTDEPCP